ncbi:MAG: hypothetical protein JO053_00560 [Acidobacteria bacterium]|nr:hypothetical protein [Acidobacteriota bacterium]
MKIGYLAHLVVVLGLLVVGVSAQPTMLRRTTQKTDKFDFGAGGTISIVGAPNGSIRIEGSNTNEVEITADVELQAPTEADLAALGQLTGFILDQSIGRVSIISGGAHNKFGMKRLPKNIGKNLLTLPFRIDYSIKVPHYCDLEVDGGKGDLAISGVEGAMKINFVETNAKIEVISGATIATFGSGTADIGIGTKGWKARAAVIDMARGDLTVRLPAATSAEIDASIIRTGSIENAFPNLKPLDRKVPFTDKAISAKAGVGGTPLKFTVGDGSLKLRLLKLPF